MAAILPALPVSNSQVRSAGFTEYKTASTIPSKNETYRYAIEKKRLTRRDQELRDKQQLLRTEVPQLTVRETTQFRNTYKHRLCTEILQGGHHRSFAELFDLIRRQADERIRAGPESVLWHQRMLTEEPEKLDTMKKYLIEAESALLKKNYAKVYECHRFLAQYFQSFGVEHKWLADHFFQNCLRWSTAVTEDDGKIAADGHCNIALSLEESGKYSEAAANFELFYALTKDKPEWTAANDSVSMHSQACGHLARIYMMLAEQRYMQGDSRGSLEFLTRAHQMALEGGDRKQLGEAGYHLGIACECNGDSEMALMHLQGYLEICRSVRDNEGIGKACDAIAKSYDSLGRVDESIKYLQMFIKVSEDSHNDEALGQACKSLGIRFNALGRYDQAAIYFEKAYNISRNGSETYSVSKARALVGIAKSHSMLRDYVRHVEDNDWPYVARLLAWKDSRTNYFKKPLPEKDVLMTQTQADAESVGVEGKKSQEVGNDVSEEAPADVSEEATADVSEEAPADVSGDSHPTIMSNTESS